MMVEVEVEGSKKTLKLKRENQSDLDNCQGQCKLFLGSRDLDSAVLPNEQKTTPAPMRTMRVTRKVERVISFYDSKSYPRWYIYYRVVIINKWVNHSFSDCQLNIEKR